MFFLLNILWFVRTSKYVLFWLYLWQLKEYHVARLLDHFSTQKGKKIFLNLNFGFKVALLAVLWLIPRFFPLWFFFLFLAYLSESLLFLRSLYTRNAKAPKITSKIIFLVAVSFLAVILFVIWVGGFGNIQQLQLLLTFDILTPLIISFIVLILQPFFVLIRNYFLIKAEKKLEEFKNLEVITITGSYGKTSTKEFLATILSKKYNVLKTKEHQNSEIGIANCILNDLKPEHQIFIAEVGAYNKGKVKQVCKMLKPEIGIVTGVNEQHLSLFGSMKNLLSAEGGGELAGTLREDGILVVNGDNKYCLDLYKKFDGKKMIYSTNKGRIESDIWAEEIEAGKDYISFVATEKGGQMSQFKASILGKHNVQNLLGVILVAGKLGMNFGEISIAVKNINQEQAGMTLRRGIHGIEIIDSSYSANPDGVLADLEYLKIFGNKKVIVMPCLIELGQKSGEIHEKIGKKIAEVCDMAIITSKECFENIKRAATEAGMEASKILFCENPQDIFSAITSFCKSGDAILLEGRVPKEIVKILTK